MAASDRSNFQIADLTSNDGLRTVDIRGGIIGFDYYEDILSPTITAKVKVVSSGGVIAKKGDDGGQKQSIYSGLPLRGGEALSLKIEGNSENNKESEIDFSSNFRNYLYVSGISDIDIGSRSETFTLNLVSREAVSNETSRVGKKYTSSISDSVKNILRDIIDTDENRIDVDPTSNKYDFIGNLRKPFTVITWLASKSVPNTSGSNDAGFFFYQTKEGFKFKSILNIIQNIDKNKKATYIYSETSGSYDNQEVEINNDFRIQNYLFEKNQNLMENLRMGSYSSNRFFFDPLTHNTTSVKYTYKDDIKNVGSGNLDIPESLKTAPSRIITGIFDRGTLKFGKDINALPTEFQSQSLTRYNSLFTQSLSIVVSLNTKLHAGDIVECLFPLNTLSKAKDFDSETSGLYMIKELCHHFDVDGSYTSMKLIRDSFGLGKK